MPTIKHTVHLEDLDLDPALLPEGHEGETLTVEFPAKWEVCWECDGAGKVDDPNCFHPGGGITGSEWDEYCRESETFAEDYMGGVYSIPCPCCNGRTTAAVRDDEAMEQAPEPQRKLWAAVDAHLEAEAAAEAYAQAEREAESRYFGY